MIKDLENAIGYHFHNIQLLQNALTHSSYANERWHNSLMSNERLEFLGDSILGMVVAEYLYKTFPDRPEGELTRMRADMVCEKTLAAIAGRIDLGVLIVDYRHPPTNNDITMARWFLDSGCPFVVVANKMDKLKRSELEPNLAVIRRDLELPEGCPVIPFSAEKGNGRDELVRLILSVVNE